MRCAIVLGAGHELDGYDPNTVPRLEFMEIAKGTGADVLSYDSAAAKRGHMFRAIFGHSKKVGSALNAAMLANSYDRIYVTAEGVGLPLAILLRARRWKGRISCVFHNMSWTYKKRVLSILGHEIFSSLITVNDIQASILIKECGMPPDKVLSVFNWVDDKFFRPAELAPPIGKSFVMACGAENRDYETLARAASRVQGRFAVYGHGYRASNLAARNSPPNVEYMPRVSYLELRDAYAACSIVVVPLNDVEYAAGVTGIVEGMAAGRPVIVTASRGIADYIARFDPATVVPPGDDEAMARAINRLSQDSHAQQNLGRSNRTFAEDRCSVDRYANLVMERMLTR